MIPRLTHSVWIGPDPMPVELRRYRARIIRLHPEWEHYFWNETSIPALRLEPWQYEHSTFAGSSNVIRLHAIAKFGGIYLDSDVEVLKPLDGLLEHSAFVGQQSDGPLCNAVFGAEPGHPWIQRMIDEYGDQRIHDAAYACHLMTRTADESVTILPPETFFAWNWDEEPDRDRITDKTIAVHHWASSWTKE